MKITDLLTEKVIIANSRSNSKESVLNELVDIFNNDPRVFDLEKVRSAVFDREKIMSTGVGKGFAIPHGKTNAITEIIGAFSKTEKKIDYDSLDGNPVRLVFLLVGKDNLVSTHIKLLSRISRMMNNDSFRERLLECGNAEEIINVFKEEESRFSDI